MFIHGDEKNVNFIHSLLYGDDRRRVCALDISINSWGRQGCPGGDIGLGLTRGGLSSEPQANQETKNQTYVLHSRTIQKLHK
jgi:hypothetical protein